MDLNFGSSHLIFALEGNALPVEDKIFSWYYDFRIKKQKLYAKKDFPDQNAPPRKLLAEAVKQL